MSISSLFTVSENYTPVDLMRLPKMFFFEETYVWYKIYKMFVSVLLLVIDESVRQNMMSLHLKWKLL